MQKVDPDSSSSYPCTATDLRHHLRDLRPLPFALGTILTPETFQGLPDFRIGLRVSMSQKINEFRPMRIAQVAPLTEAIPPNSMAAQKGLFTG